LNSGVAITFISFHCRLQEKPLCGAASKAVTLNEWFCVSRVTALIRRSFVESFPVPVFCEWTVCKKYVVCQEKLENYMIFFVIIIDINGFMNLSISSVIMPVSIQLVDGSFMRTDTMKIFNYSGVLFTYRYP